MAYMQRRARLLFRMLEPEVLSLSPRLICNFAAHVFVQLQMKLLGVPEEHIVAVTLTSPHRLLSTVVQLRQNMIDDDLPFSSKMGVPEIVDFTDAKSLKIASFLVQPCSAPVVVLDSLPIILQRAALTKATVLNSLLLRLALLNSLSPALLHIGM